MSNQKPLVSNGLGATVPDRCGGLAPGCDGIRALSVAEATRFIRDCRETHVLWLDHYREHPTDEAGYACCVGDRAHHEEIVPKYDGVLALLSRLAEVEEALRGLSLAVERVAFVMRWADEARSWSSSLPPAVDVLVQADDTARSVLSGGSR